MGDLETTPAPTTTAHEHDRLPDYVARTLDAAAMDRVEAHLLVCDACFAELVVLSLRSG